MLRKGTAAMRIVEVRPKRFSESGSVLAAAIGVLLAVVMTAAPGSAQERFGDKRVYHAHRTEILRIDDVEGHELIVAENHGYDVALGNVTITRAVSDLVKGNGRTSGYATMTEPDGDRVFYTFEGQVTTRLSGAGRPLTTIDGTWVVTGGTGKWDHRVARGTFKDTVVAPMSTVSDWTGTWEPRK
jgi:hypothetical protein